MIGTIVNCIAILIGGIIGLLLKKGISKRFSDIIMNGLALCVMLVGISGLLTECNIIICIISMVLGCIVGESLQLEKGINNLGQKFEAKFAKGDDKGTFAKGFVSASLLFCVGAMTIVGSLQSGLEKNYSTLFTKSIIDGVAAIVFASSLGVGVLFSIVSVMVTQGSITLLAEVLAPILSSTVIDTMTCVGSLLIIGLSLNMLGLTKLKVMNYVPAILFPIAIVPLADLLSTLF